ncbi:hypothetical protein ACC696_35775 [Rhizobium ruizarguesonis]|uniref:Serine-threonine protein kinase n=1 Tax=Rhizobium ruizarguesonis TaxID=2081791 RepID=A0ABY1X7J9_9HYPH|nr:hypothetical protein [Rhizobium ruizarguesonis]TAX81179.1 hypothetical protein ELH98_08925 [Rhizobium ruizarguesonis]TBE22914.1 hypothetical protein ELH08_08410 [Rhizobium ruizarguesonis]
MEQLEESPFVWLEFDRTGAPAEADLNVLRSKVSSSDLSDVVVMSHGWKNTKADAKLLYGTLWRNTGLSVDRQRKTLVVGIVWPAKTFSTDFDQQSVKGQLAQGAPEGPGVRELTEQELANAIAEFRDLFGAAADQTIGAARAVAGLEIDNNTAKDLLVAAKALLKPSDQIFDSELAPNFRNIEKAAKDSDRAVEILESMSSSPSFKDTREGNAQGIGDAVASLVQGTGAAVARFLNQLTYFEMKKRSGIVGEALTKKVLNALAPQKPVRLHLVGHSFGGRLVTAAANTWKDTASCKLFSITLLQAAYSHNGLAAKVDGVAGVFHNVIGKAAGPIVVTHTHNDSACTVAYPLASRLARDIASALGGPDDRYGAMGANGPQLLSNDAVVLHDALPDKLKQGKINSVLADAFISEHNDVTNPICGKLLKLIFT